MGLPKLGLGILQLLSHLLDIMRSPILSLYLIFRFLKLCQQIFIVLFQYLDLVSSYSFKVQRFLDFSFKFNDAWGWLVIALELIEKGKVLVLWGRSTDWKGG